jgi:hypothetical protein
MLLRSDAIDGKVRYLERRMMKAIIANTSGDITEVEFETDNEYKLLSGTVGGYIEAVRLTPGLTMWVNENGIAEELPLNYLGSLAYYVAFQSKTPILGNVIFTGGCDDEGETLDIDELGHEWFAKLELLFLMMGGNPENESE